MQTHLLARKLERSQKARSVATAELVGLEEELARTRRERKRVQKELAEEVEVRRQAEKKTEAERRALFLVRVGLGV